MAWSGEKIKQIAKERGITLSELSRQIDVSRQSINDWIKGQTPRGHHLLRLVKILNVDPEIFFSEYRPKSISIPMHRTRGVAKLNIKMEKEALALAFQYEKLFKNASDPGLVQALKIKDYSNENVISLACKLRKLAGIESGKPITYEGTFNLLAKLNIVTVFCKFHENIKSYAFYCRIHAHRVVFVNTKTNVLDLMFPLIHESVHAICDREKIEYDQSEEEFCDAVANRVQFPNEYIEVIEKLIKGRPKSHQINYLKDFARENKHALFGIVKNIHSIKPSEVGGADSNLKKEFQTIGEVISSESDARDFVDFLNSLSPLFISIILSQIEDLSIRKLSELLGIDSIIDAKVVRQELLRLKSSED